MRYSLLRVLLVTAVTSASPPPEPLAPGVISTGHEFTVTFSPDGRNVWFSRYTASPRSNHIMHSVMKGDAWQAADPAPFSAAEWADLDPALSPDGQRLYFISTRPRPSVAATARDASAKPDMDIWYVDRVGDGWSEPRWSNDLSADAKEGSPTIDRNGTICFFSDRNVAPNSNAIHCAARAGDGWTAPARLGATVNAGPSDTSPFLSPNGTTLLFYSNRAGGLGKADLYISRKDNGEWQPALNLGPVVNGPESEYNPSVSPDGKTLYFGRNGNILSVPVSELDPRVIAAWMFK